jgi:class 3 adenylate cyclase/tetratricopeptide (TPR) repeat protein
VATCPRCGQENPDGARFCNACAAPLSFDVAAPREERKVVTVLFCDLVGSTAKAERLDPEDVRAMLSPYYARLRAELEKLGGTVEKFIGDAVMALFGAPIAHEDDPERAVRAALAIRDSIVEDQADLHVRIGITTGEALVALGASPAEGEGMASGDVINTAARLQAGAPVDGILVDETTYRATQQVIDYRQAEPVHAKGKAQAVGAWEAIEARARLGVDVRTTVRTRLVGRRRELDLLHGAFARAREELSPQLLTLVGVPGIGKSRLVYEFFMKDVQSVPELIFWRQGRSLPYGEGLSFRALGDMAKGHAGILETDTADEAAAKLRDAVARTIDDETEASWVERHLRPLVGLESEADWTEDRRTESFAAWRRLFEAMAERSPLVLVFEDLQWADDGLLDFIDYLLDRAGGVPLLAICTTRPELLTRRPGWGGGKANATTVSLPALSDEETARLLADLLERAVLPASTQQALLTRSGGNPLYAEQYARLVAEHGDDGELPVPENVQGIIAARLDGLAAEEKDLLQNASIVGRMFWTGALEALTGESRFAVEERLHALERKEFVSRERRSSVAGESEYVFQHALVRDVAYGQMPRAARAEKHRLAAEWIDSLPADRSEDRAEMLAHHYASAFEYADAAGLDTGDLADRARWALREAGDRASALNAFPVALRFYRAALDLWPAADPERPKLLLAYGRSLSVAEASGAEILMGARDGLLDLGDRATAAEAEIVLAEIAHHEGRNRDLREAVQRATDLLHDAPATPSKAYVLSSVSRFLMVSGEAEAAIRIGEEALAMAEELGLDVIQAHALNNVGTARFHLGDLRGIDDLERSIEISESINSLESVRAYQNLATVLATWGNLRRAWQLKAEARRLGDLFGSLQDVRWMGAEYIGELYSRGDWDEALRLADEFVAECQAGAPHYMEHSVRSLRGRILFARGDTAGASDDAEKGLELAEQAKDPQALVPALAFSGTVLLSLNRLNDAAAYVDRALELGGVALMEETTLELVWLAVALGRGAEIGSSVAADVPSPWDEAAQAIVSSDFEKAAAVCAEIGVAVAEAYARLRAAEALADAGRRTEAGVQLERALVFYRSVGATRYISEGEAVLAASA